MDELNIIRAFIEVVDRGSFSAAARSLDVSATSIARQVGSLETLLGVRLLNRTTRKQSLTDVGQFYYANINDLVHKIDGIKKDVSSYHDAVKGRLRIHLQVSVGSHIIVPALPRFLEQHPNLTLELTLTDERHDLAADGIDVAVWLGDLQDSSLIARRLSHGRRMMCASPGYLKKFGTPKTPADLGKHNCLVFTAKGHGRVWRLKKNGKTIEVPIAGNLETSSTVVLLKSVLNGLGLAVLQESIVKDGISRGELCSVMPDYVAGTKQSNTALYAVYPNRRHVSPKARAFIDFLVDLFRHQM